MFLPTLWMLTSIVGAEAPYILTNMRNILKLFSNTSSCMKNQDIGIRNGQLSIVTQQYELRKLYNSPRSQTYNNIVSARIANDTDNVLATKIKNKSISCSHKPRET